MRSLFSLVFFLGLATQAGWNVDLSKIPLDLQESAKSSLGANNLQNLSQSEVDDLIKILHLNAQFDPVLAVVKDEKTIEIQIQSRPRVQSLIVAGLEGINSAEARRLITIQEGDSFDLPTLIRQAQALQENLRSVGYVDAEVDVEYPEVFPGKIDLKVLVKAGPALRINEIEIKGRNPDLNAKLKRMTKDYLRDILTDSHVKELLLDIEELLKKEKAYRARVLPPEITLNAEKNKARIRIVVEDDSQFSFQVTGSSQLSSLISLDETLGLQDVALGNVNLISDLTNRLRQYYLRKGYARVEVIPEEKVTSSSRVSVIFNIKEGPVVKIEKIQFQGRLSKKPEVYAEQLLALGAESLKRGFYLKEDLDKAVEELKLELQNQGYLQVQTTSTRAIYNNTRDRITITVNMDEGPLTSIDQVRFDQVTHFSQEQLKEVTELAAGEPLQLKKIEQALQALKKFYKENGFLEMLILNERQGLVNYSEDNSKAQLVFKIFEGPQVRVQSIVVEGLKKTKSYVVLYELDFQEGDLLTPKKIEESVSRIQRTGHFTSVDIRTLEDKTEVKDRTVLIRVTEANPGRETIGFGITNERDLTVRGYYGWSYRNLWGTGRGISTRWDASYNVSDIEYLENRVTAGYLEPFLFNSKYKGRINLTRSNTITDFDLERATLTTQGTASVEKDFTSNITGVWDVYSRAGSEDFNIRGPQNKDTLEIASTGVTLDFDYRDNLVRPRQGHQSRFNLEYGSPALGSTKTIEYLRASASATLYTSFLDNQITWANGIRYGSLENLSPRDDGGVPYRKKGFFLGGPSTIRGFDPTSEAFPKGTLLDSSIEDRMTGTTQMYLIRSTLSYPITGIFEGTVFYDGGQVEVDGVNLGFGYRHAAGVGLLVNTPVGPLNLEFGFKLNQKPGESPNAFHLSFGLF